MSGDSSSLEGWDELEERLKTELRYNPLDVENPPNPVVPKIDVPYPFIILTPDEKGSEQNPDGKNSVSLMNAIVKKWELELPNMVLLVHGGHAHPLQLVQQKGTQVCCVSE